MTKPVRTLIGENIHFNYLNTDKHKTNYLSIHFLSELTVESATFSKLTGNLLTRATMAHPSPRALEEALDECYGTDISVSSGKRGERLELCASMSVLDDGYSLSKKDNILGKALGLLCEIIFEPYIKDDSFDSKLLAIEKKNVKDEIHAEINSKARYARKRFFEFMCSTERYSINGNGDETIIDLTSGKTLWKYYKELLQTARIEICFAGAGDAEKVTEILKEKFANVGRKNVIHEGSLVIDKHRKIYRRTEQMDIGQSHLFMGFRSRYCFASKEIASVLLFNTIFGGVTGKLFNNVREKKSLCYSVSSSFVGEKGIMYVYAGIDAKNKEAAEEAIMDQLDLMVLGRISEEEFRSSVEYLASQYEGVSDSPNHYMSCMLPYVIAGKSEITPEEIARRIRAAKISDVVSVARHFTLDTVYMLEGTGGADDGSEEE